MGKLATLPSIIRLNGSSCETMKQSVALPKTYNNTFLPDTEPWRKLARNFWVQPGMTERPVLVNQ